jgi:hypothetical protein
VLSLAVVAAAFAAPQAHAAITTSQVTSPADPHFALYDDNSAGPQTLTVRGTTDGTTGDAVDIRCTFSGGSWHSLVDNVPVNADGSFEATGPLGNVADNTCRLRAIPTGTNPILNRFRGPRAAVSYVFTSKLATGGPNDGLLYDYWIGVEGLAGYLRFESAGHRGLEESGAMSTSIFEKFSTAFDDAGVFGARDEDGSGPRSQLRVDGHNAYAPYAAVSLYPGAADAPGLKGVTFTPALDASTGSMTLTESAPLVRCADDTVPADAVTCPEFLGTGITLDRTWVTRADGRVARLTDVLRSTDGAAHETDVLLDVRRDANEPGWIVPPSTEFQRYDNGAVLPASQFGGSPFSMVGKETDDEPDNSPETGIGAITFEVPPAEIRFFQEYAFEAQYLRTVPANGTATLRHAFSQGVNVANTQALARQVEDEWAAPKVTIESPAAGATVPATSAAVSGKATDSVGVTAVTVNGVVATLADDGAYAAVIPLSAGANTITVVARDGAGNTAQATRTVTSSPPATATTAGPLAAAGFTARLSPSRDRKAPFRFTVTGRLTPPAGKGSEVCAGGTVVIQTKAVRKTISTRLAKLRADCTYRQTVTFKNRSRFLKRSDLRVLVHFLGNGSVKRTPSKQLLFRVR